MAQPEEVSAAIFTEHRRLLVGVAYRILGSVAVAEDGVRPPVRRYRRDHRAGSRRRGSSPSGRLLAADVELVSDGGGKARSPVNVLTGVESVVRFLVAVSARVDFTIEEVNGAPAMVLRAQGRAITVVSLVIADGVIQTIYLLANPEKLGHIIT